MSAWRILVGSRSLAWALHASRRPTRRTRCPGLPRPRIPTTPTDRSHCAAPVAGGMPRPSTAPLQSRRSAAPRRRADHARPARVHPVARAVPARCRAPPLPARGRRRHGAAPRSPSLFPLGALRGHGAGARRRSRRRTSRSASSPITCATPLIMADPLGFYAKQGLNVTAGQDRGLGADPRQDAQQGIRRLPLPVADAARHLAGPRLDARSR